MVDRRVDVWAFGVVLFEMLAGQSAFTGETISDVLASVLKNDLDWSRLPPGVPPPVLGLLRRCLTADRKNHLKYVSADRTWERWEGRWPFSPARACGEHTHPGCRRRTNDPGR